MPHWPGIRFRSRFVVLTSAILTAFVSPSIGTIYPSGFSTRQVIQRQAPHSQAIVRGTAVSIDSTWAYPDSMSLSVLGLFHIEVDQILKGEEFLEDPQSVLVAEATGASTLGPGYRTDANEYTPDLGKQYLFMLSGSCDAHRKLDFLPCPIDSMGRVLIPLSWTRYSWSAFEDTFAVALESTGLSAVATTADLCATVVAIDLDNDARDVPALYTTTLVVQDVRYQPMDTAVEAGDTLGVLGPRGEDGRGAAFVVSDTLLVFCARTETNDWRLLPNVESALLHAEGQFVARARNIRCSCFSCPPYPVANYSETTVNDAISIR